DDVLTPLHGKIRSKIDVAKFFAGFFGLFLGLSGRTEIGLFSAPDCMGWLAAVGALCNLVALALAFAALSAFDSLLMPRGSWDQPPESAKAAASYVETEMLRAWKRLFLPSVGFFLAAILCSLVIAAGGGWQGTLLGIA